MLRLWSSVGIVHQSSLWLTGFRVGLRFVGLALVVGFLAIAQILSLESGIITPNRGKCE